MPGDKEIRLKIRALDRMSGTLNRVRSSMKRMGSRVKKLSAKFAIASAKTKKFRDAMKKAGRSLRTVGRGMTTRLSAPIAAAGVGILALAVKFQKSMNRVGAITRTKVGSEATPAFESLRKHALALGKATEFSAGQVADSMGFLGRAGFDANEILASTRDVLNLASASGTDMAFTADVMSKTIRQFGLEATDATRVADVMADVSRRTNVDLESLAETFKDAGPLAQTYGMSLEQTAALTGLLGDAGIQGSKAGTALKNVMLKLATPTGKAAALLKQAGIEVTAAGGKMKPVGAIISELGPKLSGLNKNKQLEILNELFGLRGIAGAAALMGRALRDGKDPANVLTKVLLESKGAAAEMQATMQDGAVGAVARFKSALEGLALKIASSGLLDQFVKLTEKLIELMSNMTSADKTMIKWGLVIAGLAMAFGPLLTAVGVFLPLVSKLVFILPALKMALGAVTFIVGLLSLKFIIIAAVIGLVAYGIYRLINRWDKMVSAFKSGQGFFNSVGRFFKAFVGDIDDSADALKRAGKAGEGVGRVKFRGQKFEDGGSGMGSGLLGTSARQLLGAKGAIKNVGGQNNTNTNNSRVDINVKDPGGNADVRGASDNMDLFSLNTGLSGAPG